MNSKHLLFAAVGLGVSGFVAIYFSGPEDTIKSTHSTENPVTAPSTPAVATHPAPIIPASQVAQASQEQKKDFRYIQERLAAMQERRPDIHFDPEQVAAAIERDVAWAPLKEVPKELPLTPEQFKDGREFISLDGLKLETLMPGDRIRIPIHGLGKEYEVIIDNVEKNDAQNVSWNGHIESSDGQRYNATFTRGTNLTVGGMDTPDGQYELQVNGDKGWIASSGLLFKNHVDPIDPNTVVPGSVPVQP